MPVMQSANQPINLVQSTQELSTSLQAIQPKSPQLAETSQLITYALIATAIVGIFIYHYIKKQEVQA